MVRPKITKNILLVLILISAAVLRLWKLDKVPVSLFSDELDVGYQAYSFINTGRDYFGNFLPLHFQSYADFRAPLYIYSSIPTVFIFGITPWGLRLPAAIFGILGVYLLYLLVVEIGGYWKNQSREKIEVFALFSAFILAFSPWHLQYSRAAFEVTQLLLLYLCGFYFFFKGVKDGKYIWISGLFFLLTPWSYSTAKLFTPLLMVYLFYLFRKKINMSVKQKLLTFSILCLLWLPLIYVNFFQGAAFRFKYISIFTDPTTIGAIQTLRLDDAQMRRRYGGGIGQKISSRLMHNKYIIWQEKILDNYLQSFSTGFLFIEGDPNLRHSISGLGQFYKVEMIALLLGVILLASSSLDRKIKYLLLFWIIAGIFPSAVTRDGGKHATRLILILPPIVLVIAYGLTETIFRFTAKYKYVFISLFFGFWAFQFTVYTHIYWTHNPWYSERSWHAGYKEMVTILKEYQNRYNKIILSNANDDPRIFLASYYPYDPTIWQKGTSREFVKGFGELEHIEKYYFGQPEVDIGIENLSQVLSDDGLYIAAAREIDGNLIMDPQKTPEGLVLVKAISYPSGEPAFYLFSI